MRFRLWLETSDNRILFYNRDSEQYGFLSNFHPAPFRLDGRTWPSVEHYYMAMKSESPEYQQQILNAQTPGKAKRLGDSRLDNPALAKQSLFRKGHKLREDWESQKLNIMKRALSAKFDQNFALKKALLDTGDAELIEDSASDAFWGIGNGHGQNWLGRLLMQLRSELK